MRSRYVVIATMSLLAITACKVKEAADTPDAAGAPASAAPAFAAVTPSAPPAATPVQSPDSFLVDFETSKGTFTVSVTRALAPKGADRFYEMVQSGYFKNVVFFRVVQGFVAQFGMHGDPETNKAWMHNSIQDEPAKGSNMRGTLVFAHAGPNTRSNQLFINFGDNTMLDTQGFPPFGRIVKGLEVIDQLNAQYGEAPDQMAIESDGNAYLAKSFPNLDYIKSAKIISN